LGAAGLIGDFPSSGIELVIGELLRSALWRMNTGWGAIATDDCRREAMVFSGGRRGSEDRFWQLKRGVDDRDFEEVASQLHCVRDMIPAGRFGQSPSDHPQRRRIRGGRVSWRCYAERNRQVEG
jgi:hypothetical protein